MIKMGRRSKVERSPHKDHYINLRKNGMSLHDLEKEASTLGEDISHQAFHRYFKNSYRIDINEKLKEKLNTTREDSMETLREHNESIVIVEEVKRNLRTLQALTSSMIQNNPTNHQAVNACTNLLKESRMTLQYLDKKRKDMMLDSETSEEMGIATLLSLLNEVPADCPKCGEYLGIMEQIQKKLEK
jgi:hypothetical protein